MNNLSQHLTIKSLDQAGTFTAIAWKYGEPDRENDAIEYGAFTESLAWIKDNNASTALLFDHDTAQPIGGVQSFTDTPEALLISGKLSLDVPKAREVYALLKDKAMSLSIRFAHHDQDSYIRADGVRVFTKAELLEVSVVSIGANKTAQIIEVKSFADCETKRDFEALVRDALGLSRRQAKTLASVGFTALKDECDAQDQSDELQQQQLEILKALDCATASILRGNTQ